MKKRTFRKVLCAVMSAVMALCACCPAFAVEAEAEAQLPPSVVEESDSGIMPLASLTLPFSELAPGEIKEALGEYYISDETSLIKIISATWNPASEDIYIGWKNVETKARYGISCSGGNLANVTINSWGVPTGRYRVYVSNRGDDPITGAIQYSVD